MNFNVFITRKLPEEGINLLKKECEIVEINPYNRALTKKELLKFIQNRDGIISLLTDEIDKDMLEKVPNIKGIANYAVGYNNIDIKAATKLKIPVSNTPDVLTNTTAELTWALIFSIARRIVEADKLVRAGKWKGWDPLLLLGNDVSNKTLGIVGAGRIGSTVAEMSKGFNMRILYTDEKQNNKLENKLNAQKVSLEELLKLADFVSIHTPLTEKTHHLIGEKELHQMKNTAYLINTSRGAVIDEIVLVKCLKEKVIAGAGLDVYEFEPKITNGLSNLENVVILPHVGSASYETRRKMAVMAAENLIAMLNEEKAPNIVNPEIYYTEPL